MLSSQCDDKHDYTVAAFWGRSTADTLLWSRTYPDSWWHEYTADESKCQDRTRYHSVVHRGPAGAIGGGAESRAVPWCTYTDSGMEYVYMITVASDDGGGAW